MIDRRPLGALAAFLAAMGFTTPSARSQDALGTGDALDASLYWNSGGWNAPAPVVDYRARNLLVTGDAPGGRAFREAVGYRAVGDFSGLLGSDDIFRFQADSAFSALPFVSSGHSAERLRYGEALAGNQFSYRRATSQLPADPYERPSVQENLYLQDRIRVDQFIRSTSSTEMMDAAIQPSAIGVATNRQGEAMVVTSSSLRGVTARSAADPSFRVPGLTAYDAMRLKEDEEEAGEPVPVGNPFQIRFEVPEGLGLVAAQAGAAREVIDPIEARIEAKPVTDYEQIIKNLVQRYGHQDNVQLSMDSALIERISEDRQALRDRLIGAPKAEEVAKAGGEGPKPATGEPEGAVPPPRGVRTRPEGGPPTPIDTTGAVIPEDPEPEDEEGRDMEVPEESGDDAAGLQRFINVIRPGEIIEHLAIDGDRGRFNELMRTAEDYLRDGEYFWAERRFIRALVFVPGHPLATAGLGHAQLGAGLYGSGANTLRSLLTHQPEMIGVRYQEGLLPTRVRLRKVVDDLRFGPEVLEDRGQRGFLLGYLGHQLKERELTQEGLALMAEDDAADPLLAVLRQVWTAEPEPAKPEAP